MKNNPFKAECSKTVPVGFKVLSGTISAIYEKKDDKIAKTIYFFNQ